MDIFELISLKGTSRILLALHRNGQLTYSELVKIIGYSTTTSRALKRLMKLELINRKVLDEDYRPVIYYLTEDGKELVKIIQQLLNFQRKIIEAKKG